METAVRKATRQDYNPPKQKHISALVSLTYHNPAIIGEMLDLLERRHRENSWIMSFKVLVILHVLMRQGNGDRTIAYISSHPACLDTTRLREKSSGVIHIQNIYLYTGYLQQKVDAYRELSMDYIKNTMATKVGRLRRLSIQDGLLKETSVLQKQVSALLQCRFMLDDVDNTISLYAFRLVVEDLLILFQAVNEGVVNILEHYFAMSKSDAQISLDIYKRFAKQTEQVTQFLDRARKFQHEMYISIPAAKHAPLSLVAALEEYLNDQSQQTQRPTQMTSTPPPRPEPEQPKELKDFFASLETDASLSPQPSVHNPFRNTMVQPNSIMTDLSILAAPTQQSPMLNPAPMLQQSPMSTTSSPLPSNANPFRSNTSPQPVTLFSPPPPTLTAPNPFMQQHQLGFQSSQITGMPNGVNPFGMSPQHQQQQQPWGSSSVF